MELFGGDAQERVGQSGIELRARAAANFHQRDFQRQRLAIRAAGSHRVKAIGQTDQPAHERDIFAGEIRGITLAVITLVVMQHAGDDVLDLPNVLKNACADLGMLFDLLEFFGRQLAGLLKHGFGHADLADIVQQARNVNALDKMIAELGFLRENAAEQSDAFAVAAGVCVLGVDGAGETVQQAHHQAAHVFVQREIFQIDRRFVADRVQQLAVHRVEIAVELVEGEHAAEQLFLPLKRHGQQMLWHGRPANETACPWADC